jgi:modulator of FtsH protease
VQAGAAATLTGLVFVAVSLNLGKIMSFPGLSGRAAESILQLLAVFFISTLALVPAQPTKIIAIEFLSAGTILWVAQTAGQIRYLRSRSGHPWSWFLHRATLSQLASVPFCVAGVTLLFGNCNAFYWLVPGFIFSFTAAMISAWVLLIEILR